MKIVPLAVKRREQKGTRQVKKVRDEKRIPAVVYGPKIGSVSIEVKSDDFSHVIHTKAGENVIIKLETADEKLADQTVVIKEIQHHPVSDLVEHVDFKVIALTDKIKVGIPVFVTGESEGIKQGGILDIIHHEIEVECLPTDIPERVDIDISKLAMGHSIHVQDLQLPAGVVPLFDAEEAVVAIHAPRAPEEEAVPEEAAAEPEVIGKKKADEEGDEAAPAAGAEKKKESEKKKE